MNTVAFNILLFIFTVLYMFCICAWIRVRKTEAYKSANRPQFRKWMTTILIDVTLLIGLVVWFLLPEVRFRAITSLIIIMPLLVFFSKTITLSIKYRGLCVLTCLVYIPMMVLYLR